MFLAAGGAVCFFMRENFRGADNVDGAKIQLFMKSSLFFCKENRQKKQTFFGLLFHFFEAKNGKQTQKQTFLSDAL
jgi:hypothetical protein